MRLWLTPGKLVRCEAGSSARAFRDVGRRRHESLDPVLRAAGLERQAVAQLFPVRSGLQREQDVVAARAVLGDQLHVLAVVEHVDERRGQSPQSLTRAPQVDVVALAEEHHGELTASDLGAVEVPDVDREDDVAAGGAQRASLLAEEQDHLRARIREVDEARARDLGVRLPAILELVARGLRERIADLPEALHEAVALMRLRQGEERVALGIRDQQRDLLEEAAVAVGHRGRAGRRTGDGRRGGILRPGSRDLLGQRLRGSYRQQQEERERPAMEGHRISVRVKETVHKRHQGRIAAGCARRLRGSTPSSS